MIASRPSSQNWVPFSAKIKCWVSSDQFNIWCKITHEIENGTSKRLELLRVKHLDQSLWWANDKTLSTSQIILIILFCTCALLLCTANCAIQTSFLTQTGIIWHFFIQFYCVESHTEHDWRLCEYVIMFLY